MFEPAMRSMVFINIHKHCISDLPTHSHSKNTYYRYMSNAPRICIIGSLRPPNQHDLIPRINDNHEVFISPKLLIITHSGTLVEHFFPVHEAR